MYSSEPDTTKFARHFYLKYYSKNKAELLKYSTEYNRKFPEKRRERHIKRLESDYLYRTAMQIRGNINTALKKKGVKKDSKTAVILGSTFKEFRDYIQSQFLPWMNWSNYGHNTGVYNVKWQLDHIIPMCNATAEKEIYLLNHWSNFQPLCAKKNKEKLCDVYPVTNLELKITIEDKQIIYND